MSIELKIKSKHLSEEARIIRFEENKLLKNVRYRRNKHNEAGHNAEYKTYDDRDFSSYKSLNHHRRWNVRNENRATFLARAYIAGVPYKSVEQKRNPDKEYQFRNYILSRVASMIARYGYGKVSGEDREWDRAKGNYAPTKQLKDKIAAWVDQ
jgi:hypothetical protein